MFATQSFVSRIAALCLVGSPLLAGDAPVYQLELLPKPDGSSAGPFADRSKSEFVVVNYDQAPHRHDPDGTLVSLPGPGTVHAVNDRGIAAGGSPFGPPVLWLEDGERVELPVPPGMADGVVHAVNDRGRMAGRVRDQNGVFRAVVWNGPEAPVRIPDLGTTSGGTAVGNNGHVAGSAVSLSAGPLAGRALYFDGEASTFVNFGLGAASFEAINDSGRAAGGASSTVPQFPGFTGFQAFVYHHRTGETEGLGFLTQFGYFTSASDINNAGDVVGFALRQPPGSDPIGAGFLWRDGEMFDLNELVANLPEGAEVLTGWDIDDAGVVLVDLRLTPGSDERTLGRLVPQG